MRAGTDIGDRRTADAAAEVLPIEARMARGALVMRGPASVAPWCICF
jgi:hypothetical protein